MILRALVLLLAFTAAVALLPEFIVDAQTARMYVFLVTCVTGYMILLFRWERSDNAWYLAGGNDPCLGLRVHRRRA